MSMIAELVRVQRRAAFTWVALVLATLAYGWLGGEHRFQTGNGASAGAVLIVTIAFIKIRFIGTEFMEIRTAPRALQTIFHVLIVGIWGAVVGFYLLFGV